MEKDEGTRGFYSSLELIKKNFKKMEKDQETAHIHWFLNELLEAFQTDFGKWLAVSPDKDAPDNTLPSRFLDTNADGLWKYSPYLCGVGLAGVLEASYLGGMYLWDYLPEVLFLIHLHSMLVQEGHLEAPLGLYTALQDMFPGVFFHRGVAPRSNYHKVLNWHVSKLKTANWGGRRRRQTAFRRSGEVREMFSIDLNGLFKENSVLGQWACAEWDATRISPDSPTSALSHFHTGTKVGNGEGVGKAQTGEISLHSGVGGLFEEAFPGTIGDSSPGRVREPGRLSDETAKPSSEAAHSRIPPADQDRCVIGAEEDVGGRGPAGHLAVLKEDLSRDVCGSNPRSGINYLKLASYLAPLFGIVESKLKARRNATYILIYEERKHLSDMLKRLALTDVVLMGADGECVEVMAAVMRDGTPGMADFVFWDGLDMGAPEGDPEGEGEGEMDEE